MGEIFSTIDQSFAWLLGDHARLVVWASVSGVLSMLLYKLASPQSQIRELDAEAAAIRQALAQHSREFAEALPLLRTNFSVALRRLRVALAPSLLAGLPIVICLFGLDAAYHDLKFIPFGPDWITWWGTGFLLSGTVAAFATKLALRIK